MTKLTSFTPTFSVPFIPNEGARRIMQSCNFEVKANARIYVVCSLYRRKPRRTVALTIDEVHDRIKLLTAAGHKSITVEESIKLEDLV